MKSATAATKPGILLSAAPAEFQEGPVSRDELNALQADPPSWLANLRCEAPPAPPPGPGGRRTAARRTAGPRVAPAWSAA
ncbi:DUF5997 family protein [Actinomadura livida]|nr:MULTISPECIES: DUF5997 family protein [Actinomadura]MBB4775946.1 hypothetical protein [Actinomadura catellatispora]